MNEFILTQNTRAYFGEGNLERDLQKENAVIRGNILIVTTGRSLIRLGHLERLENALKMLDDIGEIAVFDKISQNPKLEETIEAIRLGESIDASVIIGFGGGSAIDAAKAVAVGIPIGADLDDMEEYLIRGKKPDAGTLPIIAIPTTAGTGSELSKAAIISSVRHHIKGGIRGENVCPEVAVIDSKLTWSVPTKITMETGFDVLAHAVESYVSIKANPYSEMLSEKAIEIVGKYLPILKRDSANAEARLQMSFASMIMGINLGSVGTCLPHRMQYPIGTHTDTSHGAGLIALYPAWLQHEYMVNEDKVNKILKLLGLSCTDGQEVKATIQKFQNGLCLDYSLKTLGVKEDSVSILAKQVTGSLENDKAYRGMETLISILEESMER